MDRRSSGISRCNRLNMRLLGQAPLTANAAARVVNNLFMVSPSEKSVGSHASSGGIHAGNAAASAAGREKTGLLIAIPIPRWIAASIPRTARPERFHARRPAATATWACRAARAEPNNRRGAQALHKNGEPSQSLAATSPQWRCPANRTSSHRPIHKRGRPRATAGASDDAAAGLPGKRPGMARLAVAGREASVHAGSGPEDRARFCVAANGQSTKTFAARARTSPRFG
jgi:hypothetical protein